MRYDESGVNYDELDPYKRVAQQLAGYTDTNATRFGFSVVGWSRGESVFLVETPWGYLGFVVEGLGTKSTVADLYRLACKVSTANRTYYTNIAQCNVAMAVNDLITLGVYPVIYNQYAAVGDSAWFQDLSRSQDIAAGTLGACLTARCVWGGGETPALSGIIMPQAIDLAGATVGIITNKDRIINPDHIRDGDVIVLIESSGIHANGLSMARRIADKLPKGYLAELPSGRTYGEALLDPTHIYVGLVEDCLEAGIPIHYAVNITGHGWRKLMRAKQPFTYTVEKLPTQLPIFDFIQANGPVDDLEAYGTFNMGAGFALYVPSERDALRVLGVASRLGLTALIAGHISAGERKVVIKPKGLEFKAETLGVR